MTSVVLVCAVVIAVVVAALVQFASSVPAAAVGCGLCASVVAFNALEVVLFRLGPLKLTHVNAEGGHDGEVIHPQDPSALEKAEDSVRAKKYAGTDRQTRATQARQLKETLDMAKSLRGGEQSAGASARQAAPARKRARCRLRRLSATDEAGIRRMSALATGIVREHYDSIIGEEQNDYMIARFQSPEAIAAQLEEGYEYYFILPPKQDDTNPTERRARVRPLGYVSVRQQAGRELLLSKFYILKEERGKGYGRSVVRMVAIRARKLGCDHVKLYVNRNNYQAILAYEHLGFVRTGERCADIGGGFVMDDYVYELTLS